MSNGGNQNLTDFLDKYDLNSEDIKVKYNTKACAFYRKRLTSLATNQDFNE